MKSKAHTRIPFPLSSTSTSSYGFARQWQLSARRFTSVAQRSMPQKSLTPHPRVTSHRPFHSAPNATNQQTSTRSYDKPASELNHDVTREEKHQYDQIIADTSKARQIRTPWHRDGSEKPPVSRLRQASAMTKGKLLTTPTRLFKLVLPLTTRDHNSDRKSVEPLALLVHPSQPLSYLERLIQSELPLLTKDSTQKIPDVNFRAEDALRDDSPSRRQNESAREEEEQEEKEEAHSPTTSEAAGLESYEGHEDPSHTHLRSKSPESALDIRGGPGEGGVETYSPDPATVDDSPANFVRWSKSTEIGDFIRDAARGSEFAVEIEGAPSEIRVGVPSFGDRTYYLRLRLRKKAGQIASMADVKRECDLAAGRYSQRVAQAGFGAMCGWGGVVAWLTFETELGWDVMEPVTYLVGLAGLLGGYAWFLAHNREASYRSAMNLTHSRRQQQLYDSKGFDLPRYQYLVEEGNALRKEIMAVASEYDVEWDEKRDARDERVVDALKEDRQERKRGGKKRGGEEEDDD